jgi:hypothetical protein
MGGEAGHMASASTLKLGCTPRWRTIKGYGNTGRAFVPEWLRLTGQPPNKLTAVAPPKLKSQWFGVATTLPG